MTAGRTTGFARLINEKTMVQEATPLDLAVTRLCPSLPDAAEAEAVREAQPLLDKFLKELVAKLRLNTFHMLFDEPLLLTGPEEAVWWPPARRQLGVAENDFDVLLSIRRLPGTKIDHSFGAGYASVWIQPTARFDDSRGPDNFEFVRSANGRLLSPRAVCRVQHRIMQTALRTLEGRYGGALRVDELGAPDRQNSIPLRVSLSHQFLDRNQQQQQDEAGPAGRRRASEMPRRPRRDEEEEEEEAEEAEETEEAEVRMASRMTTVREEEEAPEEEEEELRPFRVRFFTGMNCLSKERIYFTARPYAFDRFSYKDDVWRYFYALREAQILRPVFRADQSRRLRAMAGLVRLCATEPDLAWVSAGHARQLVLHRVQTEVDCVRRWQRLSLVQCVREMLADLRAALAQRRLAHYFIDGLNLLQTVDAERQARAAVRCSVFTKSDSALTRAATAACEDPGSPGDRRDSEASAADDGPLT